MMRRLSTLSLTVLAMAFLAAEAQAQALTASANVGWVSEYLYRGIPQSTSSASAGLDLGYGALSLGTWAADVKDGAEVDVYGGVGLERGDFHVYLGGTGYLYTGDFDDPYVEGTVGLGFGPVSAAVYRGQYHTDPVTLDYTLLELTAETGGVFLTLGSFHDDFGGEYAEIGYGATVAELDLMVALVLSSQELALLPSGNADATLVLGLSKSFELK